MTLSRRLLSSASGAGSFTPPSLPADYVGLINAAATSSYVYTIGPITSSDGGATWTPGASAVLSAGTSGAWDDGYVKDPALVWDGSQYVCYYAGYDGAQFRIGRATAATLTGSWTKYGSNPVIDFGAGSSFDEYGAEFPIVLYEPDDTGAEWKMWYAGYPNGATPGNPAGMSIGYAYSSDGLSWTKHGQVLAGTGAGFEESGTCTGTVVKLGSTYYLFYGGWSGTLKMRAAYATFTSPTGTYTRQGQITDWTGNLTVGGWTWQSNLPRAILPRETGTYRVMASLWNPTPVDTEEACVVVAASPLTTWATPSALAVSLGGGTWYANSAENPSVIAAP